MRCGVPGSKQTGLGCAWVPEKNKSWKKMSLGEVRSEVFAASALAEVRNLW